MSLASIWDRLVTDHDIPRAQLYQYLNASMIKAYIYAIFFYQFKIIIFALKTGQFLKRLLIFTRSIL